MRIVSIIPKIKFIDSTGSVYMDTHVHMYKIFVFYVVIYNMMSMPHVRRFLARGELYITSSC